MTKDPKCLRVLSIDGGVMRGLYSATYLNLLAQHYAASRKVSELDVGAGFNLIVGVGTGAIIACALAINKPLKEVVRLYSTHGPKVFPVKMPSDIRCREWRSILRYLFKHHRSLQPGDMALTDALEEVFKGKTIGDVWREREIALAIPAVEMSWHRSWIFKTPHLPDAKRRDDDYKLADVCLATSATPVHRSFARVKISDQSVHHVFADGGLWASNPVFVALIEALEIARPEQDIEVFCLRACPPLEGESVKPDEIHRGFLGWKLGSSAMTLSLGAQEFAFHRMARMITQPGHLNQDCHILQFPYDKILDGTKGYLDLDETSEDAMEALEKQAKHDVKHTLDKISNGEHDAQLIDTLFKGLPPRKGSSQKKQK